MQKAPNIYSLGADNDYKKLTISKAYLHRQAYAISNKMLKYIIGIPFH